MAPLAITHVSDTLCIWAYVAQIRIDKLVEELGDQIALHYHYVSVFGVARDKLAARWRDKGGLAAYADHVLGVARQFDHVAVNPAVWREVAPASSMPSHVVLCAVRALEAAGAAPAGAHLALARRVRDAWFRDARDIADAGVLADLAREAELDHAALARELESGRAHAAFAADLELAREQDLRVSPTLLFNEGRQRLTGNVGYRVIVANVREILERPETAASWC